jgi:hypothetical protein
MNYESLIALGYDLANDTHNWLNLASLFFFSITELWLYSVIFSKVNFKTDNLFQTFNPKSQIISQKKFQLNF